MDEKPGESIEDHGGGHPLGPLIFRYTAVEAGSGRGWAAAVLMVCVTVLGVAVALDPDPSGMGTHRQLNMEACSMIQMTGIPCPTCGMTTAFAQSVRGQWWSAVRAQPFGFILAMITAAVGAGSIDTLVTGKRWSLNWYRLSPARVALGIMALMLLAWAWKIASVVGLDWLWSLS